ncbi:hypothetical protein [Arachidicoccus ginsenosidimutans]|nr:hypothetical protein [Arachidicoccus sp. BS20]
MSKTPVPFNDKDFKPTGAIVFFILLLVLCMLIWFSVYNIQVQRH